MTQRDRYDDGLAIQRLAFVTGGDQTRGGRLCDITPVGAAIAFVDLLGETVVPFRRGQPVSVQMDDFRPVRGAIATIGTDSVAVTFDADDEDQRCLLEEIAAVYASAPGADRSGRR